MNAAQRAVLGCYVGRGSLTDRQLVAVYKANYDFDESMPPQTPSGIRTRRAELCDMGELARVPGRRPAMFRPGSGDDRPRRHTYGRRMMKRLDEQLEDAIKIRYGSNLDQVLEVTGEEILELFRGLV